MNKMKRSVSNAVLELFCSGFLVIQNSSNKHRIGNAALINFFVPNAALIRGRRLFEGGAYSGAALIRVNTVCITFHLAHALNKLNL